MSLSIVLVGMGELQTLISPERWVFPLLLPDSFVEGLRVDIRIFDRFLPSELPLLFFFEDKFPKTLALVSGTTHPNIYVFLLCRQLFLIQKSFGKGRSIITWQPTRLLLVGGASTLPLFDLHLMDFPFYVPHQPLIAGVVEVDSYYTATMGWLWQMGLLFVQQLVQTVLSNGLATRCILWWQDQTFPPMSRHPIDL